MSYVHEVSVSLRSCSPLFTSRTSCRTPSTVDNLLRTPHDVSMDLSDESYSNTQAKTKCMIKEKNLLSCIRQEKESP